MKSRHVLVAPLDWGLGHASRCIPVIQELLALQCQVSIASSGRALTFLQKEFPLLKSYPITGYNPIYPVNGSMMRAMSAQFLKFRRAIRQEHTEIENLVQQHRVDWVISDNRYGCWTTRVPCVFITHQSNILMPERFGWLAPYIRYVNHRLMNRFTQCWLPDGEQALSGALSEVASGTFRVPVIRMGTLSRFKPVEQGKVRYEVLAILSGPEPQRTALEVLMMDQLNKRGTPNLLIRGVPEENNDGMRGTVRVVDFMTTPQLQQVFGECEWIVARSGYSTVMDMAALGKKAIFIPTPGQPEQIHLAHRLRQQGVAYSAPQSDFVLNDAIIIAKEYSGFQSQNGRPDLLRQILLNFIHENLP